MSAQSSSKHASSVRPRYFNPRSISDEMQSHLASGLAVDLVFGEGDYTSDVLPAVNRLCRRYRDAVNVDFIGQLSDGRFDASALRLIPDVVFLSIVARSIEDFAVVRELTALRGLRFSMMACELPDAQLLTYPNLAKLEHLELTQVRERSVDLSPLVGMRRLREIRLDRPEKGIAAIAGLPDLSLVSLRSVSKRVDLGFLGTLPALRTLELTLGGHSSLDAVASASLEDLSVIQVRGFCEGDFPARFPNLRSLRIHDQIRLLDLSFSPENTKFRKLEICNCSGLTRINGLPHLGSLDELRIIGTRISFDDFMKTPLPRSLTVFGFSTLQKKTDLAIRRVLDERGYAEFPAVAGGSPGGQ